MLSVELPGDIGVLYARDFTALRAEKLALHMRGTRSWTVAEFESWMKDPNGAKLFWLMGGAGTGKTVVSALLLDRLGNSCIAAHHFCQHTEPAASQPRAILLSLAAQLCRNLGGFSEKLVIDTGQANLVAAAIAGEVESLETIFSALLLKPLIAMGGGPGDGKAVIVLLIDALDELPANGALEGVLELLTDHFAKLPAWVRVAVTSREEANIPKELMEAYTPLELRVDEARNQQDVRAYLSSIASQHVAKTISIADLELAVERAFPGTSMHGVLGELEEPMRLSLACYDKAVDTVAEDPDYERLLSDVEELRPTDLRQSISDMDDLYRHAEVAHAKLCGAIAGKWQLGKSPSVRVPVPGTEAPWVCTALNPGVKSRTRAAEKLEKDYGGDVGKLKDLARCTLNFATCGEMIAAIEALKAEDGFSVVALKNRYANPTPLGYRDLNLSVAHLRSAA
jgi:hypothetical protein